MEFYVGMHRRVKQSAKEYERYGPSHSTIHFRQARRKDVPDLLELIRAYYRFDHIRFEPRSVHRALVKLLCSPALGRAWIARHDSKAVGYVLLTFNYDLEFGGKEGIVTDLFIVEAYRGQGLGKCALKAVNAYCRSRRIHTVELQVERRNGRAQKFYRRLGFRKLSRVVMSRGIW